jgi:hypothetical protein
VHEDGVTELPIIDTAQPPQPRPEPGVHHGDES